MATIGEPKRKVVGAQTRSTTPPPILKARAEPSKETNLEAKGKGKGEDELTCLNDAMCRAKFLRKVYGILTAQIFFTVAVAAICMHMQHIRDALVVISTQYDSRLQWGLLIPTIVSLLVLKCGAKDSYPWNYICLSCFTICISINVGYVCAIFEAVGLGDLVLEAFGMTGAIFLGLTAYTLYSGKDFSYLRAFFSVALGGLVLTGFLGWFFPGLTESLAFGFIGALTFCGYILYDTSRLLKKLSYDDYILGTIELYLDIINLFFYILKILAKLAKSKSDKNT